MLVHVVYGLAFTTLFFRNFYAAFPTELVKAAHDRRRGLLPDLPARLAADLAADPGGHRDLAVHQIWNDFLFGASFAAGGAAPVTVALNNIVNTSTGVKEYNVDMAAAMIDGRCRRSSSTCRRSLFVRGLIAGAVKG